MTLARAIRGAWIPAALLLVAPLFALGMVALGHDGAPDLDRGAELRSLILSLATGSAAALLAACIGVTLAFQVSFAPLPARRLVERVAVLPLVFPTFVLAASYRYLGAASGPLPLPFAVESAAGLVLLNALGLYPYVYLLARAVFATHGRTCVELGQSLGLSASRAAVRLLLPLALPAVLLGTALVLVEAGGEWAGATLLSVRTTAVEVHDLWLNRSDPSFAAQLAAVLTLTALLLSLPASRLFSGARLQLFAAAPAAALTPKADRGPLAWARFIGCLMPPALAFALPAALMLYFLPSALAVIDFSTLAVSAGGTFVITVTVAGLCLGFAVLLPYSRRTTGDQLAGWCVRLLTVGYLIPGSVVAVGSLLLVEHTLPFVHRYSDLLSFLVLAATLCLRFAGFVLLPLSAGLALGSRDADEAGVAVGLGSRARFWRLRLPAARSFLLVGLLLLLVQVVKETPVSVLLRPFAFRTLALQAYAYIDINLLRLSSAWVVPMALFSLYPILVLESLLSGRRRQRS